jgi:hypothetical protein
VKWHEVLTNAAFCQWAVKVGSGAQVHQGQRLDPFGTSMRHFGQPNASHLLGLVEEGKALPGRGGAGTQDQTDLRFMGLIQTDAGKPELTALGQATLRRWRTHGVADDDFTHEVTRHVLLLVEAKRLGHPDYGRMLGFWMEVRRSYDVDQLLNSQASLYLVSYLNQTVDGYNPWVVIRDSRAQLSSDFDTEWADLRKATSSCPAGSGAALDNIKDRIVGFATRGDPRTLFCAAMELIVRASSGGDVAGALGSWRLPIA